MSTPTPARGALHELARRTHAGTEVSLFWHDGTGELTVCVANDTRSVYFEVYPPASRALDCFYHPYAYATAGTVPDPGLVAAAGA
jgi:hypothetical protein